MIELSPAAAHSLLELWWSRWEVQMLERSWYSRPATATAYRSGCRESPRYVWSESDLERLDAIVTRMHATDPAAVARLREVHVHGACQDESYRAAVNLVRGAWCAYLDLQNSC